MTRKTQLPISQNSIDLDKTSVENCSKVDQLLREKLSYKFLKVNQFSVEKSFDFARKKLMQITQKSIKFHKKNSVQNCSNCWKFYKTQPIFTQKNSIKNFIRPQRQNLLKKNSVENSSKLYWFSQLQFRWKFLKNKSIFTRKTQL